MIRSLIQRLAKTLAPGGRIAIKDMFIDARGVHSEFAVFFGLTMLYYTRKGESPTAAGLVDVRLVNMGGWELLSGQAPG